jgi:hypothetical protein
MSSMRMNRMLGLAPRPIVSFAVAVGMAQYVTTDEALLCWSRMAALSETSEAAVVDLAVIRGAERFNVQV